MSSAAFDLAEAAARLGVHYMTAYKYVRTGRLTAEQVAGRWQVTAAELDRFRQRQVRPSGPRSNLRRSDATALVDRIVAGDETGAWQIVEQRRAAGLDPRAVITDLFAPAMTAVGDRWERGELGIAGEHVGSSVMHRLVARLGTSPPRGRRRGTVVLAAVSGERHALPIALVAALARDRGLRVVEVGADCPAGELAAIASTQDRLLGIGLCATTPLHGPRDRQLRSAIGELHGRVQCPVLLGGAAVATPDLAASLGADGWSADGPAAVDWFMARARGSVA